MRLLLVTARHTRSRVASDTDAALVRLPARLASILRRDTTVTCADRIAPALLAAAAALALGGADRPKGDGAMLGEVFAAVLEPAEDPAAEERVQTVGLY